MSQMVREDARVVDKNVDGAELLEPPGEGRSDRRLVDHVEALGDARCAGARGDAGRRAFDIVEADVNQNDGGAGFGEAVGDGSTETPGGPGDDGESAREVCKSRQGGVLEAHRSWRRSAG